VRAAEQAFNENGPDNLDAAMLEGLNEQRQRELSAARSALEQWLRGAVESISSLSMRAMRELDAEALALSGAPPRLLDPDDESSFDIWDEVHH
jgi:hypothetical protein